MLFLCLIGTIVDVISEMWTNRETNNIEPGFPFLAGNLSPHEEPIGPSKLSLESHDIGESTANLIPGAYQSHVLPSLLHALKIVLGMQ